jgi:YD repeat-containing protein
MIAIEIEYRGTNADRQRILTLGAVGLAFALMGWALLGWARVRLIDVNPDGGVTIIAPIRRDDLLNPGTPRLELRETRARAHRYRWDAFGLLVTDGQSWALLALCPSREDCLDAFLSLPLQVQRIPLQEPPQRLLATIHWT